MTKRSRFQYEIAGDSLHVTLYTGNMFVLSKSEVKKMWPYVPASGPGKFRDDIYGASYIWGILHDRRIRKTDW